MKFGDFIEKGKVRKGTADIPKIKSLLQTSNNHSRSWTELEANMANEELDHS